LTGPEAPACTGFGLGIEAIGIRKEFVLRGGIPGTRKGRVLALNGVDLRVPRGAAHGLIGPNGSGKSTLMRILSTLILPTSGTAIVGGLDVTAAPLRVRQLIGLSTGDERSLYWRLTGRQNLDFYAGLYNLESARDRIAETLAMFELTSVADRPVATYSQGMIRRLGLARAVVHDPAVLLLDEPTRSLDPVSREHFHDFLRRLQAGRGTTILLATHDLLEASDVCDSVSILQAGLVTRRIDRAEPAVLQAALREVNA
jgi:ABC-2 type transport system ATP-binding protein